MSRTRGIDRGRAPGPGTLLDAVRRERDLASLAEGRVLDVLVVGGGITGAGVALDAASRGLSVALVEQSDLASGTSRWSSKLVHGGLRYLATGQVAVAAESTRERGILAARVAPHLIRPLAFVTPLGSAGLGRGMATGASLAQHGADALRWRAGTSRALFPPPRRVEAAEVLGMAPGVRREGLRGGLLNWDGQLEDDARLVVAVARTAAGLGAQVLTDVEVLEVGPGGGTAVDRRSGCVLDLRARTVVNATGVWADRLDPQVRLRPSRGTHLVLPAEALGRPAAAVAVPVPGHFGRVLFALPHPDDLVLIGLTDEAPEGLEPASQAPVPPDAEVDFLLDTFSEGLARPLCRADLLGAFAGYRPLLAGPGADPAGGGATRRGTADLSRRHAVLRRPGMLTVTGGKLTTYRRMAQDVVDLLTDRPCWTHDLPLVGAGAPGRAERVALPPRLVRRFGAEATHVVALAQQCGLTRPEALAPLAPGVPALVAEVVWAVRAEGALSVEEVLDGRLRLDLVPARRAAARPRVEELVAGVAAVPSRAAPASAGSS